MVIKSCVSLFLVYFSICPAAFAGHEEDFRPGRALNGAALYYGSRNEPTLACLMPRFKHAMSANEEEIDRLLKRFFGGTNNEQDNGCPYEKQTPKVVCFPQAYQSHLTRANLAARARWDNCPESKNQKFVAPFTNSCTCSCKKADSKVCWGNQREENGIQHLVFKN